MSFFYKYTIHTLPLLRFVRREKEIAETKAEASETESMRYRQRAEHLQRDLEETKQTLELEFERTKGLMLTKDEHKEIMEKIKKCKELEVLNKELEKQKASDTLKLKNLNEKVKMNFAALNHQLTVIHFLELYYYNLVRNLGCCLNLLCTTTRYNAINS